jgi:hypothetical protein
MKLDVRDLLGIPFLENSRDRAQGLSCSGACDVVLERLGHGPGAIPITAEDYQSMISPDGSSGLWGGSRWKRIGVNAAEASQVGDVVLARDHRGVHLSILVDDERWRFLSSDPRHGVVLLRRQQVTSVEGVYRLEGPCD